MPTTTNFGWTTPADSDYVTNGASAMRNLGNGADATVQNEFVAVLMGAY